MALADVFRLASETKSKFVELCVAVARLVGVLVEHVALDPSYPKTAKDSKHLHAYSLALIDTVKAFASLDVNVKVTWRPYSTDQLVNFYDTNQFIGASALLGALVCARSGRGSDFGRLFITVFDAAVANNARCVFSAVLNPPLLRPAGAAAVILPGVVLFGS
jgi:hypothetical protein